MLLYLKHQTEFSTGRYSCILWRGQKSEEAGSVEGRGREKMTQNGTSFGVVGVYSGTNMVEKLGSGCIAGLCKGSVLVLDEAMTG